MGLFKLLTDKKFVIRFNVGDLTEGDTNYPVKTTASGCPITGLAFSDNVSESMYDSFQVPSHYIEGADVTVGVHYFNSTTQTGTQSCSWVLDYQVYNDFDNVQDKVTTRAGINSVLPINVQADTYIRSEITMSGIDSDNPLSKDKFVTFSICRDCGCGTDTLLDDAVLALLTFEFPVEEF